MAYGFVEAYAELRHHHLMGKSKAQAKPAAKRGLCGQRLACHYHRMAGEGWDDRSAHLNARDITTNGGEHGHGIEAARWVLGEPVAGEPILSCSLGVSSNCFD